MTKPKAPTDISPPKHFIPLPLLITTVTISGFFFLLSFRDGFATGRPIFGSLDEAYLRFTKSDMFYEVVEGKDFIKSSAGGMSAIASVTTDQNNMGGLFVRKVAGTAGMATQLQKLIPMLFQPDEAHWELGHFHALLYSAVISNLVLIVFLVFKQVDLSEELIKVVQKLLIPALLLEIMVYLYYTISSRTIKSFNRKNVSQAWKTPSSITNRVVMRAVCIVSGVIALIAGRDLFYPGTILSRIPRDDIYLEWTGALIHSPPIGSVEEKEFDVEKLLYIGDKFISQLCALFLLINCWYKFCTAFFIRYGHGGSGEVTCRLFWRIQTIGDALLLFIMRLFAPAALSASLDLRWHLMMVGFEMFVLGVYAFL